MTINLIYLIIKSFFPNTALRYFSAKKRGYRQEEWDMCACGVVGVKLREIPSGLIAIAKAI